MAALAFKDMSFGDAMLKIICGYCFSILLFIQLIMPECLSVLCTKCNETATYRLVGHLFTICCHLCWSKANFNTL